MIKVRKELEKTHEEGQRELEGTGETKEENWCG